MSGKAVKEPVESKVVTKKDTLRSMALFALAGAIVYLAVAIIKVAQQIPAILQQVEQVNATAIDAVDKANPVIEAVPGFVLGLQDTNHLIPQILKEAEAATSQIPAILQRVDSIQQQLDALHNDLPGVLKVVEQTNKTINETNTQIEAALPLVPLVLAQVEQTRDVIPDYLTRVENLVDSTRELSEEAGKGAVSGVLKGILTSPFGLLKNTRDLLFSGFSSELGYTEEDFERVYKAAIELLNSADAENQTKTWRNTKSGNSGEIRVTDQYSREGSDCKQVELLFRAKKGTEESLEKQVCMSDSGQWELVDSAHPETPVFDGH